LLNQLNPGELAKSPPARGDKPVSEASRQAIKTLQNAAENVEEAHDDIEDIVTESTHQHDWSIRVGTTFQPLPHHKPQTTHHPPPTTHQPQATHHQPRPTTHTPRTTHQPPTTHHQYTTTHNNPGYIAITAPRPYRYTVIKILIHLYMYMFNTYM